MRTSGRPQWAPTKRLLQDVLEWDVATWKGALRFWTDRSGPLSGKSALDIGARGGGLSLFLALNGCEVVCSDLFGPQPTAVELHRRYGVQDLVSYQSIDATAIAFPDDCFDIVAFKSVLGALGSDEPCFSQQRRAMSEIHRVLKPGGALLFAENMMASPLHRVLRRRFVPWGTRWQYFTPAQIVQLASGFAAPDLCFQGFVAAFGRSERQRIVLHGFDSMVLPLVPVGWRYVVFGMARK